MTDETATPTLAGYAVQAAVVGIAGLLLMPRLASQSDERSDASARIS